MRTALLSLLFFGSVLFAASTTCSGIYLNDDAPDILNTKLLDKTKELCYSEFAVMHSGISRTPLWSAEHLTKEELSKKAKRSNKFHAEERLSPDERAELEDYAHSGYDRGHMSPSADFTTKKSNIECFTLANMVPQNHNNNTGIWSDIESATREITKEDGELYIITGPLFIGDNLKRIGARVLVPTKLFKAIYIPSTRTAAAYLTDNAKGNAYRVISIAELEKISGIDFFPMMSKKVKEHAAELLKPKAYHDKKPKNQDTDNFMDKIDKKVHNFYKGY